MKKYLLKEKGMTIKGVRGYLKNPKTLNLDDSSKIVVNNHSSKRDMIRKRVNKITKIIKELKKLKDG